MGILEFLYNHPKVSFLDDSDMKSFRGQSLYMSTLNNIEPDSLKTIVELISSDNFNLRELVDEVKRLWNFSDESPILYGIRASQLYNLLNRANNTYNIIKWGTNSLRLLVGKITMNSNGTLNVDITLDYDDCLKYFNPSEFVVESNESIGFLKEHKDCNWLHSPYRQYYFNEIANYIGEKIANSQTHNID